MPLPVINATGRLLPQPANSLRHVPPSSGLSSSVCCACPRPVIPFTNRNDGTVTFVTGAGRYSFSVASGGDDCRHESQYHKDGQHPVQDRAAGSGGRPPVEVVTLHGVVLYSLRRWAVWEMAGCSCRMRGTGLRGRIPRCRPVGCPGADRSSCTARGAAAARSLR